MEILGGQDRYSTRRSCRLDGKMCLIQKTVIASGQKTNRQTNKNISNDRRMKIRNSSSGRLNANKSRVGGNDNDNNNNNDDDDDDDDDNINNNSNTAQSTELDTVFQNIKAHGAFKSIKSAQNTMTNKNKQKQRQTKLEVNSERRRRARERLPARGREPKRQHRRINESSSKCWFRVNIHIGGRVCGQMRGVPSGDRNTGWSARENRQVSEIKMILIQNDERLWRRYNQVRGIWDAADGDVSVINACYLGNVSERTCVSDQLATLVPLSSAL